MEKLTIEEMHSIAKKRLGFCLSVKYKNTNSHLKWQCKFGHIWKATPNNVKKGTWCPVCAGKVGFSIKDMIKLANKKRW